MTYYRNAIPADGPELAAMAAQSFTETFGTLYRPEDLAHFIDRAFGPEGLPSQIGHPDFSIQVAKVDGRIAGYAKLGPVAFPGEWTESDVELYQIYVLAEMHGSGIGAELMDWAIRRARAQGYKRLVLSVFIENIRAQRFYARYGMREIGKYEFRVGDQIDDDRIWALDL